VLGVGTIDADVRLIIGAGLSKFAKKLQFRASRTDLEKLVGASRLIRSGSFAVLSERMLKRSWSDC